MSLHHLIYMSTATDTLTDEDIDDILKVARRENSVRNINGALIYQPPYFVQILEGDDKALNQLVKNIRKDKRNHNLNVLMMQPIEKRVFPDWSMAYISKSQSDLASEKFRSIEEILKPVTLNHDWLSTFMKDCLKSLNH